MNELCRRVSNIQLEEIPHKEIIETVEHFIGELKNSEYSQKQARDIVISGLRGWQNMIRKRKRNNMPFYRHAQETVRERMRKQLVEKESWYKETEKDEEEIGSPNKYRNPIEEAGGPHLALKVGE